MKCLFCDEKVVARGLCRRHYYRRSTQENLSRFQTKVEAGTSKEPLEQRLMLKVEKHPNGCWNWTGARSGSGYGAIQMWPTIKRAHRVSYEHFKGPIPKGLLLRHTCDNKLCINPDHLLPGTKADNGRDSVERGQFKPRNKLTAEQVNMVKNMPSVSGVELARRFGVHPVTISNIRTGKRWSRVWNV